MFLYKHIKTPGSSTVALSKTNPQNLMITECSPLCDIIQVSKLHVLLLTENLLCHIVSANAIFTTSTVLLIFMEWSLNELC